MDFLLHCLIRLAIVVIVVNMDVPLLEQQLQPRPPVYVHPTTAISIPFVPIELRPLVPVEEVMADGYIPSFGSVVRSDPVPVVLAPYPKYQSAAIGILFIVIGLALVICNFVSFALFDKNMTPAGYPLWCGILVS